MNIVDSGINETELLMSLSYPISLIPLSTPDICLTKEKVHILFNPDIMPC